MPTELTTKAAEEGTYIITAAFTDEDGTAIAPVTATWTLTDAAGSVINSRLDVAITSPTSSEEIVLSGNDLSLQSGESGEVLRFLTIKGTYDSDAGSGLTLKGQARFVLSDLIAVT